MYYCSIRRVLYVEQGRFSFWKNINFEKLQERDLQERERSGSGEKERSGEREK